MDYLISKRAGAKEVITKFVETVIDKNQGPFENAFRILPYAAIPLLGSLGKVVAFILTKLAMSILGIAPEDFGRMVDEAMGLGPGDDPRAPGIRPKVEEFINNLFASRVDTVTANQDPHPISKTAGALSLLIAGGRLGKILAKGAYYLITMASSAFVFSHLEKSLKDITEPAREKVTEWTKPDVTDIGVAGDEKGPTLEYKRESADDIADYIEQKYGLK